jgi:hypothetical protein
MLFHHHMPVAFGHSFPIRPLEPNTDVVLWASGGPNITQDQHVVLETSWDNAHWRTVLAGDAGDVSPLETTNEHILCGFVRARVVGGEGPPPDGTTFAVLSNRPLTLEIK